MTDVRELPQDRAAEQSVLGAAMQSSRAFGEARQILDAEDFYFGAHRAVFEAIATVDGQLSEMNPIAVSQELQRRGDLVGVGGVGYLHTLIASAPVSAGVGYCAGVVAEKAQLRRLIEHSTRMAEMAYAGSESGDVARVLEHARDEADAALSGKARDIGVADPNELADNTLELLRLPKPPSTPMGYPDLDALTGGMEAGQLICIAARPGVGKSVLALGTSLNVTSLGKSAAFFSFEMLRDEIATRAFANLGRVHLTSLRERRTSEWEWQKVERAADEFRSLGLHISDKTEVTTASIRSTCRDLARSGAGLDLIVVDYLQLATFTDSRVPREQQVASMSRALKKLAMELRVPVIVVSQLNRGPEQRTDKKPRMDDLRESGSIEQDCDKILLLHHDQENEILRDCEIQVAVAKNRQGATGQVTLAWSPHYSRIDSLSRQEEPMSHAA